MFFKVRVKEKSAIYLPKAVTEKLGIREGTILRLTVKGNKTVLKPIPSPFELALRYPKFARTTIEEFEKESEEMQAEILSD